MPPKRPAPLSDKALVKGDADAAAADAAPGAQRELPTDAGLQMTVKNTFIDVPSGHSPTSAGGKPPPLMTAPAQSGPFIQRKLESAGGAAEPPAAAAGPTTPLPQTPATMMPATPEGAPLRLGWPSHAGVSDRQAAGLAAAGLPGHAQIGALPSTPLVTPSPSSNSLFSAARYQLFGGPAPLQPLHEVPPPSQAPATTAPPMAPVGLPPPPPPQAAPALPAAPTPVTPLGAASAAPTAPAEGLAVGQQLTTTLRSGPFSYGSSTIAGPNAVAPPQAAAPAPAVQATLPPPPPAEAHGAAAEAAPRPAERADGGGADSDDDSDEGGQKMPQVGVTGARTAEEAPKPPPGAKHPSLGSENHEEATCKRCCFFPRNRCLNGYQCEFCHYEHEKRKRKNKKSKKKNKDSADAATGGGSDAAAAAGGVVDPSLAALGAAAAGTAPMGANPWLAGVQDPSMQGVPSAAEMHLWEAAAQHQLLQQQQDLAGYGLAAATSIQQGFAHLGSNQLVTYQWVDGLPGQHPPLPFAGAPGVVDPSMQQGVPSIPLMYHQVPQALPPAHLGGYGIGVDGLPMPPPLSSFAAGSLQPPYPGAAAATDGQAQATGLVVDPAWRPPFPAPQYDPAWQQAAAAAAMATAPPPSAAALAYPAVAAPAAGSPGAPPPLAPALPEVMQGLAPPVAPAEPPSLPPPPSHEAAVPAAAEEPPPGS